MLRSEAAVGGVIRLSTVTEPDVPWQIELADTTKHPEVGLEQGEQTLRSIRVHVALHRPIAAGRVGIEPTARLHGQVGGLLYRLDREIFGRVDHNGTLAADPRDDGWPVFVEMAPTGLAFLAAPARSASQRLLPALLGLSLVASGMIEVIRFHRAFLLAVHLIGHGRIAQPPAPPIAGPDMDA